jgi:simple sugar transport system permease protein
MAVAYRLERRLDADPRRAAALRVAGAVAGLLVAGLVLLVTGRDPFSILSDAVHANLGSKSGLEETGVIATPILMTALAVALSLRMRLWNIGADGQFLMGAFAATGIGIHWAGPDALVLIVMALAGMAAGALWILIPALARAYWGVNEIITTLLLNFVALQLVTWASLGFWQDKAARVVQSTPRVSAELPAIPGFDSLHVGFLVPIALALVLFWVFRGTKVGYEIDMIGGNPRAAAFAGIRVPKRIVVVMLCTGAIAGLAGMVHLSGAYFRLQPGISTNYGLSGFIVAALAGGSFLGLVVGGLFIASVLHAGTALQTEGLSVYIVLAIYGALLMGIALGEAAARYRVVRYDADLAAEAAAAKTTAEVA